MAGPHPREVEELAQEPAQPIAFPEDQVGEEPLVGIDPVGSP